jgi:hypothetical protein
MAKGKIRVSGKDLASMLLQGGYKGFNKEQEKEIKSYTPRPAMSDAFQKTGEEEKGRREAATRAAFQKESMAKTRAAFVASKRTPLPRTPETDDDARRYHSAYTKLQANKKESLKEQRRTDNMDRTMRKEWAREENGFGPKKAPKEAKEKGTPLLKNSDIRRMSDESIEKVAKRMGKGKPNNVKDQNMRRLQATADRREGGDYQEDSKELTNEERRDMRKVEKAKAKANRTQSTDAQSKTARVPKGLKKIADKLSDKNTGDGKWITINGARIYIN